MPIPNSIPDDIIPAILRDKIGPDASPRLRKLIARAQVPMPPAQLGVALCVLAHDPDPELANTAIASLRDLPRSVVQALAGSQLHPRLLDVFARALSNDLDLLRALLRNESCEDDTISWMARKLRGPILANIGTNQRRLLRSPAIIESLINNVATPTPTIAAVLEAAIRNDLDLGTIRNAKALAEGFFGETGDMLRRQRDSKESDPAVNEGIEAADMESLLVQQQVQPSPQTEVDSPVSEEPVASRPAKAADKKEDEDESKALWQLIAKMSMAQKVRLATVGDVNARKLLIRDVKRSVFMTVLKSPRLTAREISTFASNKTLNEDVISYISRKREWTKAYSTRIALVKNPKCPANQALVFLKTLRHQDLMKLARAKDVPAYIARGAKTAIARTQ